MSNLDRFFNSDTPDEEILKTDAAEKRQTLVDKHRIQSESSRRDSNRDTSPQIKEEEQVVHPIQEEDGELKVTSYRWLILAVYSLSLTSTAFGMMNFASVSKTVAQIYDVDDIVVNSCVLIFLISFIFNNFLTVYALEYSVAKTFKVGAVLAIIGAWVRWVALVSTSNFYMLMIGQGLIALTQPFIQNGTSKVATTWFADNERAIATSIGSLSTPVGAIMGMVFGPFYIFDGDATHPDIGEQHNNNYMFVSASVITAMNIGVLLFYREKPKHFPSQAAKSGQKEEFNMKKELKIIIKNKNYIFLNLVYAMVYGVYGCLGAIINNLASAYDFNSVDASIFGAVFVVLGLVGSFAFSIYLDRHNAYLKALRIVCVGGLVAGSLMRISFNLGRDYLIIVIINIGLFGFFLIPIIPVCYSFSVELTYPVSEAMSNGSMMLVSQLLSVFGTILATKLADNAPNACIYMFMAMMAIGCVGTLFIKEDLRRINVSKEEGKEAADELLAGNAVE